MLTVMTKGSGCRDSAKNRIRRRIHAILSPTLPQPRCSELKVARLDHSWRVAEFGEARPNVAFCGLVLDPFFIRFGQPEFRNERLTGHSPNRHKTRVSTLGPIPRSERKNPQEESQNVLCCTISSLPCAHSWWRSTYSRPCPIGSGAMSIERQDQTCRLRRIRQRALHSR